MLEFREVALRDIKDFIEQNHYTGSVNGCKVSKCYAIFSNEKIVGAALYGGVSTTSWKRYVEKEGELLELRRLVTTDKQKNLLSKFVSWSIRRVKKEGYKMLISYADPYHEHIGYIYQATNWYYAGQTNKDTIVITPEGKQYHSRAMRTKYNGQLKPFAARLQDLYEKGMLTFKTVPGKHIYTYNLRGRQKSNPEKYPKEIT